MILHVSPSFAERQMSQVILQCPFSMAQRNGVLLTGLEAVPTVHRELSRLLEAFASNSSFARLSCFGCVNFMMSILGVLMRFGSLLRCEKLSF